MSKKKIRSEEAKLEYLREKIKQAKRRGIIYNVLSVFGLAGFVFGVIDWAFDLIIMGVALFCRWLGAGLIF